jgi:flagellar basal body rod protein FlgG
MINGMYISAMGMQTQQYRQSVFANNLANAQTPGFKRAFANLQARANATIEDPAMAKFGSDAIYSQMNGGVWAEPTSWDWSQGTLIASGSRTDFALNGSGFFQLKSKDGSTFLTRNGHFVTTNDGELVAASTGHKLMNSEGEPIKVKPELPFEVTEGGTVIQEGNEVGKIAVVNINDTKGLEPIGSGLIKIRDGFKTSPADAMTSVRQGYMEQSGVDPVVEMVSMLEGQRTFEANARMLSMQDQMLSQLNTIGRVA